ncbi:unnamed protein product, partial [Didymodactylos carnosus]
VATTVPKEKWLVVNVNVSPSTITICHDNENNEQIFECRIRYLSFMGAGMDPKCFGIIIHCADNTFKCHVFQCEPSCAQLCKTIEAACKLRYQKCIDAHPQAAKQIEQTKVNYLTLISI